MTPWYLHHPILKCCILTSNNSSRQTAQHDLLQIYLNLYIHQPINQNKYQIMYAIYTSHLYTLSNLDNQFTLVTWYLYSQMIKDLSTFSFYCLARFRIRFSRRKFSITAIMGFYTDWIPYVFSLFSCLIAKSVIFELSHVTKNSFISFTA